MAVFFKSKKKALQEQQEAERNREQEAQEAERNREQRRADGARALLSGSVRAFEAGYLSIEEGRPEKNPLPPGAMVQGALFVVVVDGRYYLAEHGNAALLSQVCDRAKESIVQRAIGQTEFDGVSVEATAEPARAATPPQITQRGPRGLEGWKRVEAAVEAAEASEAGEDEGGSEATEGSNG